MDALNKIKEYIKNIEWVTSQAALFNNSTELIQRYINQIKIEVEELELKLEAQEKQKPLPLGPPILWQEIGEPVRVPTCTLKPALDDFIKPQFRGYPFVYQWEQNDVTEVMQFQILHEGKWHNIDPAYLKFNTREEL